jgi:hypothetical protein
MNSPITNIRLRPDEKTELQRAAAEHGISLAEAMRRGARIILGLSLTPRPA